ncbi:Fe-S protein assembly chaperone HscA [Parasutterella secunda]|uniref:Chaperone protein HscA homolog n=1 Tax=Parasutterella secunda TaxID=626947 RepID=A0ABS2GU41_9BURK|nr:Fe-S protein assembly chaperone HscA [Parasutterella secunda]MBM6928956.1 Fe-S protein assembly chaperone HscA [Parasutterella secunda]
MALLQIAEPGMSADPHQHRLAVGIDLGTTNSLVATVKNSETVVLADHEGRKLLPSVVRFLPDGSTAVGYEARRAVSEDAQNTIVSVKRFMGRSSAELKLNASLPYVFAENEGMLRVKTVAGDKSPVEISSEILKELKARAEESLGGELVGAVITVPAYFDDAQRQATKDAARLAGLNVLRLLNEPTAAALAYGLDEGAEGLYVIYDLGGGTFDVSVLRLTKGVFEVLATGGDSALGGDDFDHRIFCWAVSEANLSEILAPDDKSRLMVAARAVKEALSTAEEAAMNVTLSSGQTITLTLTRAKFKELTSRLVQKTIDTLDFVMRDAKLDRQDIQGLVLVGGSTRMPVIREAVKSYLGFDPLDNINPDEVVAVGAAKQANLLAGNSAGDDWLLLDVTPLSLGLETMGGLVEKIIPRNTPIPVAMAQDFTTFKDGQTAMAIHVVQGEREIVDACRSLARFELRGLPALVAGAARIRVTFSVDADGLLSVSARETQTGVEAHVTVKPSYGLTDEEIMRMLKEGTGNAQQDMHERALREEEVESRRLIESTVGALATDADLLTDQEQNNIRDLISRLLAAVESHELEAIKSLEKELTQATESFAERRMDRAIAQALSGKSVEDIEGK